MKALSRLQKKTRKEHERLAAIYVDKHAYKNKTCIPEQFYI